MKFLKGLALRSATLHSAQGPLNDSKTVYTIYFILPASERYFVPFGIKDLPDYWICQILNTRLIKIEIGIEIKLKRWLYLAVGFLNYDA